MDVRLKSPKEFLTSYLLTGLIETASITEQQTQPLIHVNFYVKKINHGLLDPGDLVDFSELK